MVMQGTKAIMQDQILRESPKYSSVSKVQCYVCGKGLEDGHSITAKTLPHGIVLFCDVHFCTNHISKSGHLTTKYISKN